jgi:TetR/AcrR family transcriptional regulator, transcriptional repressor for nem operon
MRYSKQRKQDTRDRIVRSARTLFASKGFAATSIDEIMRACSLTRGGFYAHFSSKSELYREALGEAALGNPEMRPRSRGPGSELKAILDQCLSSHGGEASMLGFLASDVASDDPAVRAGYTAALKSLRDKIRRGASGMPGGEEAILASAAMIVGALAISRTADDAVFAESLLDACRRGAETLLEHADVFVRPAFFWMPTQRSGTFT